MEEGIFSENERTAFEFVNANHVMCPLPNRTQDVMKFDIKIKNAQSVSVSNILPLTVFSSKCSECENGECRRKDECCSVELGAKRGSTLKAFMVIDRS